MTVAETSRMIIQDKLTIDTVNAYFREGLGLLESGDLCVDLSGVETVDSAAISMVLGLKRAAQKYGRQLSVVSEPQELLSLAHLYGVDGMLPLADQKH